MAEQNPMNPVAGTNPLIDKMIGNAYEVIKYVAYYVKEIRYVATNMEHIYAVSQNMYQNVLLTADVETYDTTVAIDLPEGVTALMIINTGVNIVTVAGDVYAASADNFSWVITGGQLVVTIPAAPDYALGSTIRWLINWQSPVVVG